MDRIETARAAAFGTAQTLAVATAAFEAATAAFEAATAAHAESMEEFKAAKAEAAAKVTRTAKVGNGNAVHAYTEWTSREFTDESGRLHTAATYRNTECGAVEAGGNALYGHRRRTLTVLEGDHEVTCQRCIKALAARA